MDGKTARNDAAGGLSWFGINKMVAEFATLRQYRHMRISLPQSSLLCDLPLIYAVYDVYRSVSAVLKVPVLAVLPLSPLSVEWILICFPVRRTKKSDCKYPGPAGISLSVSIRFCSSVVLAQIALFRDKTLFQRY